MEPNTGDRNPALASPVDTVVDSPETQSKDVMERHVAAVLRTPWDSVYALNKSGTAYISPHSLSGVPVAKLVESDPYYDRSWLSLDKFLAHEPAEEASKKEYHDRLALDPKNKHLKDTYKRHQDNVSKHRKIREIFGPSTPYHPNQLMTKHHLPSVGLCEKEVMYKLACKISDLRVLHDRGELSMDPWDFLRWRIAKMAHTAMGSTWESTRKIIRSVAIQICDDSGEGKVGKYEDRLLRKAILRSAQLQGRLASFGSRNVRKPHAITRQSTTRNTRCVSRSLPAPMTRPMAPDNAMSQDRRKRREALSKPTEYQGVNAFRAQRIRPPQTKL